MYSITRSTKSELLGQIYFGEIFPHATRVQQTATPQIFVYSVPETEISRCLNILDKRTTHIDRNCRWIMRGHPSDDRKCSNHIILYWMYSCKLSSLLRKISLVSILATKYHERKENIINDDNCDLISQYRTNILIYRKHTHLNW